MSGFVSFLVISKKKKKNLNWYSFSMILLQKKVRLIALEMPFHWDKLSVVRVMVILDVTTLNFLLYHAVTVTSFETNKALCSMLQLELSKLWEALQYIGSMSHHNVIPICV